MKFPTRLLELTISKCLQFILISANANVRQNVIPIMEYEIELTNERHLSTDFRYVTVNSKVLTDWNDIPDTARASFRELEELEECRITLPIGLLNYKPHLGKRTLCLFRNTKWANDMDPVIETEAETLSRDDLIIDIQPITGFVISEPNSLVEGYLVEGSFYGAIRVFDQFNGYHIHFSVEPIKNILYYSKKYIDEKFFKEKQDNAILFEYIGHEDQFGVLLPPEHVPKMTRRPAVTERNRVDAFTTFITSKPLEIGPETTTALPAPATDGTTTETSLLSTMLMTTETTTDTMASSKQTLSTSTPLEIQSESTTSTLPAPFTDSTTTVTPELSTFITMLMTTETTTYPTTSTTQTLSTSKPLEIPPETTTSRLPATDSTTTVTTGLSTLTTMFMTTETTAYSVTSTSQTLSTSKPLEIPPKTTSSTLPAPLTDSTTTVTAGLSTLTTMLMTTETTTYPTTSTTETLSTSKPLEIPPKTTTSTLPATASTTAGSTSQATTPQTMSTTTQINAFTDSVTSTTILLNTTFGTKSPLITTSPYTIIPTTDFPSAPNNSAVNKKITSKPKKMPKTKKKATKVIKADTDPWDILRKFKKSSPIANKTTLPVSSNDENQNGKKISRKKKGRTRKPAPVKVIEENILPDDPWQRLRGENDTSDRQSLTNSNLTDQFSKLLSKGSSEGIVNNATGETDLKTITNRDNTTSINKIKEEVEVNKSTEMVEGNSHKNESEISEVTDKLKSNQPDGSPGENIVSSVNNQTKGLSEDRNELTTEGKLKFGGSKNLKSGNVEKPKPTVDPWLELKTGIANKPIIEPTEIRKSSNRGKAKTKSTGAAKSKANKSAKLDSDDNANLKIKDGTNKISSDSAKSKLTDDIKLKTTSKPLLDLMTGKAIKPTDVFGNIPTIKPTDVFGKIPTIKPTDVRKSISGKEAKSKSTDSATSTSTYSAKSKSTDGSKTKTTSKPLLDLKTGKPIKPTDIFGNIPTIKPTDFRKSSSGGKAKGKSAVAVNSKANNSAKLESDDGANLKVNDGAKTKSTDSVKSKSADSSKSKSTASAKSISTDGAKSKSTDSSKSKPSDGSIPKTTSKPFLDLKPGKPVKPTDIFGNIPTIKPTSIRKSSSGGEANSKSIDGAKSKFTGNAKSNSTNSTKSKSTDSAKSKSINSKKSKSTDSSKTKPSNGGKPKTTSKPLLDLKTGKPIKPTDVFGNLPTIKPTDLQKLSSGGEAKSTNRAKSKSNKSAKLESDNSAKRTKSNSSNSAAPKSTGSAKSKSMDSSKSNSTTSAKSKSTDGATVKSTGSTKSESSGSAKSKSTNSAKSKPNNSSKPKTTSKPFLDMKTGKPIKPTDVFGNLPTIKPTDLQKLSSGGEAKSTNRAKSKSNKSAKLESDNSDKRTKSNSSNSAAPKSTGSAKSKSMDSSKSNSTASAKSKSTDGATVKSTGSTKSESSGSAKSKPNNSSKPKTTSKPFLDLKAGKPIKPTDIFGNTPTIKPTDLRKSSSGREAKIKSTNRAKSKANKSAKLESDIGDNLKSNSTNGTNSKLTESSKSKSTTRSKSQSKDGAKLNVSNLVVRNKDRFRRSAVTLFYEELKYSANSPNSSRRPQASLKHPPLSVRCSNSSGECAYGLRGLKSCLRFAKFCHNFKLGSSSMNNYFHITSKYDQYGSMKKLGRRKRQTIMEVPFDFVADELLKQSNDDIADDLRLVGGISSSNVFDSLSETNAICQLCIWVQPHFAEKFGFHNSRSHGIGEVINIISMMNWLFRAMDFNNDGIADNVGFKIKIILVSDQIKININETAITALRSMKNYYNYNKVTEQGTIRKRRSLVSGIQAEMDYMNSLLNSEVYDDPTGDVTISKDADGYSVESEYLDPSEFADVDDIPGSTVDKSRAVYSIDGRVAYHSILEQIQNNSKFTNCCAVVAFIYHNLSPSLSVTTRRGLCSSKNLVLVSGMIHMHKVGKYDILRALMHAFGHMLGASHDNTMKGRCQDRTPSRFLNPFIMHPVQQLNVGLRPNSFRFSLCSKHEIVTFLSSNNAQCLIQEKDNFCGNGILDVGEECDCASMWQCHERSDCCGERDTPFGCKLINRAEIPSCPRPEIW